MHELSIAQSLLEIVQDECDKHGVSKVTRVCIRIGTLSTIVPEALTFSFEVITEKTIAEGAALDIQIVPAMGRCPTCKIDFEIDRASFLCPECGGMASEIISGQELEIAHIEAEQEEEKA
ncbi:MAG: hydrogenase maturation nickel metallochaperone HypA [Thermodesulfobacteriota bacterium]|nr:hydrogenase maturation nickel metallochaperone HypA [Thermodesulfobacteriota bacterium]